ncbi:MAG: hypothetical protein OEY50_05500 [Nitrospinota bacterium]|nr:hypothetical protein [Nitrospinota bacterium]MDH5679072.1 hypothetical protein [Nitrospinota bacterium]MDH5755507.1 hypothetical protein [Nitrospinota bacterium]
MPKIIYSHKVSLVPILAVILVASFLSGCSVLDQTCRELRITNESFPDGEVGIEYVDTVNVESGCSWFRTEGRNFIEFRVPLADMPPGVDIDAMGAVSGVPTTAGVFHFTITAVSLLHFFQVERDYSITIHEAGTGAALFYYPQ